VSSPLLSVSGLSVDYGDGAVVDGLSMDVAPGQIIGLVGESGCGKTSFGWAVLGSLPRYARVAGSIMFEGEQLFAMKAKRRRELLGLRLSCVPQSALASLDPMYSVRRQLSEVVLAHRKAGRAEVNAAILKALSQVGLSTDEAQLRAYPHQLSGGMRQRVAIAAAMLLSPALIIADEPTSSLDVTSQAQVLFTFKALIKENGSAVIFITHDLGVVALFCERVAVMYAGQIVEEGNTSDVFEDPKHPYTKMLLEAHPGGQGPTRRLATIPGSVPEPKKRGAGCSFMSRCPVAVDLCRDAPPWVAVDDGRLVRCVHYS